MWLRVPGRVGVPSRPAGHSWAEALIADARGMQLPRENGKE